MDLMRIPLFDALVKRMTWLGDRQTVLAENVANADTPGYAPRDLRPPNFHDLVQQTRSQVTLVTTQPDHIAVKPSLVDETVREDSSDRSLDGNGVSLEREMMKVSQTANDFALTSTLYRANINLIKTAIGSTP